MDEVVQEQVRAQLADEGRGEVEVIVLQEHDGLAWGRRCGGHHLFSEESIDCNVSLVPGLPGLVVDVGRARSIPKIMLQEPEQGIGDPVVIAMVGFGIGNDEAKSETRQIRYREERFSPLPHLLRDDAISGSHRAGHPNGVGEACCGAHGSNDSACAPLRGDLAIVGLVELDRPAVGDDDQGRALEELARVVGELHVQLTIPVLPRSLVCHRRPPLWSSQLWSVAKSWRRRSWTDRRSDRSTATHAGQ
jgi:hypothetical protein